MKMVTRIAFDNLKYNKSKNILTGIAIFLTTLLLFVIPTVGKALIDVEYATVNETYPSWHALYRNVKEETIESLAVHHDIGTYGLRSDVGYVVLDSENTTDTGIAITMMYLDRNGVSLYKQELQKGALPEKENEIVVSEGMLKALNLTGDIGDTITLSYQVFRDGGLDYKQEKAFVISGFLADTVDADATSVVYTALVSETFLKTEMLVEDISYYFLFQVADVEHATTDNVEDIINQIAGYFSIPEDNVVINSSYLQANYVDPAIAQIIIVVMLIVVIAGVVTIYSIYYVSMAQRVQAFGRIKAIGATKKQIKQIVLREGMLVALCAIPIGLLMGTLIAKIVLLLFVHLIETGGQMAIVTKEIITEHKIPIYHIWIYLLAIGISLVTVYFSLLKPMRMAGKVSVIEAMRFQGNTGNRKSRRKGYTDITVGRLAKNNIFGNKKKSLITIVSMSLTGIFIMVVASVLSCTNAEFMTNEDFIGQYVIVANVLSGDKEHPEWEWTEIQKDNPLNEDLKEQIEALDGVKRVDAFSCVDIGGGLFIEESSAEDICGLPEAYAEELEEGIIEGTASYEDLKTGDKVVVDQRLQRWYPELSVGSKITVTVHDGDNDYEKELEIIAIGDFRSGLLGHGCFMMAKEAADRLSSQNINRWFSIIADEDYDAELEEQLYDLISSTGLLDLQSRQSAYDANKTRFSMVYYACYIFLGILSLICIMNLINTMVNSVNIRRKEFGMMQAIGMSNRQLQRMLLTEGLFYTVGTLLISLGAGSLLGYAAFLWAKKEEIMRIREFQYPVTMFIVIICVLIIVQILLVLVLGKSVKKESLIDRIRFSE